MAKKNKAVADELPVARNPVAEASPFQAMILSAQSARAQSGPLPSPATLKEYDAVMPGLGERIVQMAEAETRHRREVEQTAVALQVSDQRAYRRSELLGQIFALASAWRRSVQQCTPPRTTLNGRGVSWAGRGSAVW